MYQELTSIANVTVLKGVLIMQIMNALNTRRTNVEKVCLFVFIA